jgi:hypothetical protein
VARVVIMIVIMVMITVRTVGVFCVFDPLALGHR